MTKAQQAELDDCKKGLRELKAELSIGKKRELIEQMARGGVEWTDPKAWAMAETLAANFLSDLTINQLEAKYGN